MIEFNDAIINGNAVKRAFGGATASMLNYYSHELINEYKPNTVIIMAGTNNLSKRRYQMAEEIADEVMQIVKTFRNAGVKKIFVSSVTCRPRYQNKVNKLNELLQHYAGVYGFDYIDNACIVEKHLVKDRRNDSVHLNREGIRILTNNFLAYLNSPPTTLPFASIWN